MLRNRRTFIAALVGGLAAAAVTLPAAAAEDDLFVPMQYRRGRRCRVVRRRVVFRNRFGRLRERIVTRQICR